MRFFIVSIVLSVASWQTALAFTPSTTNRECLHRTSSQQQRQQSSLHLFDAAHSILIATIDSDIANIPDNEFAPVFMGGMAVMGGGVLSALFVGTVIDQKNMYGQLVSGSYAQAADDEEFWKSLGEEDRVKLRELLARLNDDPDGEALKELQKMRNQAMPNDDSTTTGTATTASLSADNNKTKEKQPAQQKEIGMFSDYAE